MHHAHAGVLGLAPHVLKGKTLDIKPADGQRAGPGAARASYGEGGGGYGGGGGGGGGGVPGVGAGPGGPVRAGDWTCPSCNVNNFASRTVCFRCQTAKSG